MTLSVTVISFLLALVIGAGTGVARTGRNIFNPIFQVYVEIFRGTPLLIQLFFIYYGLPEAGIAMPAFTAAVTGLGLNGGAYISEIIRAAVLAIDPGQQEAALALGLTRLQTLRYVIFPQAVRIAVPPLMNTFSSMLKESSLVSVLAICEISRLGQLIYTRTFRAFEVYLVVGAIYFCLTFLVSRISRRLERRLRLGWFV